MNDFSPYLPIIVSGVGLVAWFIRLESGIKSNGERIIILEGKEHDLQPTIRQIALDTASIKADISWLKGSKNAPQMTQNN